MRGFTLAEMLVVIAVAATAGLALLNAIPTFYRQNAYLFEATGALGNARRGLSTALDRIREASYAEDGAYPLLAAATSSLSFHADVDGDAAIERVRYTLIGTTFYESITNPAGNPPTYAGQPAATSTVIAYIANSTSTPIFRYYGADGAEVPAPIDLADVTAVQVMMQVDLNPLRAPDVYTLTGNATLRNLRPDAP